MRIFHCKCCGNCCRWEGVVHYKPEEGARIAAFLGISEDRLIQEYTRLADDRTELVFIDKADGSCIFLTEAGLCSINPVKPHQCSSYPYEWDVPTDLKAKCQGSWEEAEDKQ